MEETVNRRRRGKNPCVSSPAETVLTNTDLLTQILLRVPASSLVKFKFLSKQWYSIIADPEFCLSHTQFYLQNPNPPKPTSLILSNHPQFFKIPLHDQAILPSLRNIEADSTFSAPGVQVLQSCNGLFVCSVKWLDVHPQNLIEDDFYVIGRGYITVFFLYNPTTLQFKKIKFPRELRGSRNSIISVVDVAIAFDPAKSPYYNLICVVQYSWGFLGTIHHDFHLYSSQTDSWSFVENYRAYPRNWSSFKPIYFSDAVHWLLPDRSERHLYLEVGTCLLKKTSIAFGAIDEESIYFGESGGRLCCVKCKDTRPISKFDVFESALDFSEWELKYRVKIESIRLACPELVWENKPFSLFRAEFRVLSIVSGGDNEEGLTMVLLVDGVALAYDFHHSTARKLCDVPIIGNMNSWRLVFPHFESLFCL